MNETTERSTLEQLSSFDLDTRNQLLVELSGMRAHAPAQQAANMHAHTFYSFNAYGYSPSALAWLAHSRGYAALGIVDFDVLDGVDEFLDACHRLGVRGSAGIETRVFVPEFADREINSPGEPGILYHMGIGFTSSLVPAGAQPILDELRRTAAERNRGLIARVNSYLDPVTIDYDRDVLPLTPGGNATERHIVVAYIAAAARASGDPVGFWADKLGMERTKVAAIVDDDAALQGVVRSKLMKKGGVGYVQPGAATFPQVERFHELIVACGALPTAAWLDGLSTGEQAMAELLSLLVDKGVVAFNIVPDRNWNIADPELRARKVRNLYAVVELANAYDLPLNIGTEMNSYGQKLIDDFDAPELAPVRAAFLDGAYFAYGHTVMQRNLGMGYQSEWTAAHLPGRRARNEFYTAMGKCVPPGRPGAALLARISTEMSPAEILAAAA